MADFAEIIKGHAADDGSIPATAINTIVQAIKTAVGNEYVDKERYKAKLSEIDQLKEAAQTAEDGATTAGKWKDKYDELKKEHEALKTSIAEEKAQAEKEAAYRSLIADAGLSEDGLKKAMKYAEWAKIELDEKGQVKDAKDHLKAVREEWASYIVTNGARGAQTATPPQGTGGAKMTRADIYKKDDAGRYVHSTAERQKMLAENPDLLN